MASTTVLQVISFLLQCEDSELSIENLTWAKKLYALILCICFILEMFREVASIILYGGMEENIF